VRSTDTIEIASAFGAFGFAEPDGEAFVTTCHRKSGISRFEYISIGVYMWTAPGSSTAASPTRVGLHPAALGVWLRKVNAMWLNAHRIDQFLDFWQM